MLTPYEIVIVNGIRYAILHGSGNYDFMTQKFLLENMENMSEECRKLIIEDVKCKIGNRHWEHVLFKLKEAQRIYEENEERRKQKITIGKLEDWVNKCAITYHTEEYVENGARIVDVDSLLDYIDEVRWEE